MQLAKLSIFVEINDAPDLIAAARKRYMDECPTETTASARAFIPDGDVSAALCMLLDPGVSPAGCTLIESSCELS